MRRVLALMLCAAACGGDDGTNNLPDAPRVDAPPPVDARPDAPEPHISLVDASGNAVTQLTFVNVAANASVVQTFFVLDDGGAPTDAIALATTAPFSIDASTTTCNGAILGVDSKCKVGVKFTPTTPGTFTGTVDITAGALTGSVALSGGAITSLAAIDAAGDPVATLAFDPLVVGDSHTSTFLVKNVGTVTTQALSASITGAGFEGDLATTTCASAMLVPGGTCTVGITFAPQADGPATGTVTVGSGSDQVSVALTGDTIAPALLALDSDAYDFGTVTTAPSMQTITLSNAGGAAAPIDSYDLSDPSGAYTVTATTCGATLAGGASCTFTVTFSPLELGEDDATFEVISGGVPIMAAATGQGAIEVDVVLAGTGTGDVTSDPTGIDCGTACTLTATSDVTLSQLADDGSQFDGWDYPGCDLNATCSLDFVGAVTVTATFDLSPAE